MKYTVLWTAAAQDELARIWTGAQDRRAVTSAADAIDSLLGQDPETCGESRYDTARAMFALPLGIDFEILADDRIVYVLAVWLVRRQDR